MPPRKPARKSLRIAIDGRTIIRQRTGIGAYAERLVRSLLTIDKTNAYTLFLAEPADQITAPNLRKVLIPGLERRGRNRYWENIRLPRFIEEEGIDILFSPAYSMPLLPRLEPVLRRVPLPRSARVLFRLAPNVRYIVTVHDMIAEHSPHYFTRGMRIRQRLAGRTVARLAHHIIADSVCTKNDIVKFYQVPAEHITVIYPALDRHFRPVREKKTLDRVRKKYALTKRYVLYMGTIEPRKNVSGILQAYTRLPAEVRAQHSLLIGGGTGWHADETEEEIRRLGAEYDIRRLGYVDHEDLPALYSMATLFVFPSFYEGFGYPPLEAMACGTPVITSNISSLPEVVGNAALLVNPHHIGEIARAIDQVLTNRSLRQALRTKGLRQAGNFDWKKCAKETLRLLTE